MNYIYYLRDLPDRSTKPLSGENVVICGLPPEITFDQAPYEIEAGDNFTAEYSAWYWTWNVHSRPDVQKKTTGGDGAFTVSPDNGGLWMIEAQYGIDTPGNWTATYETGHFAVGDVMPYNGMHCRSTLSVWVG